jgi:molecular chaperone DnaK
VEVGTASQLESAIASLREAVKGDDLAAITSASEQVQRASHAVAEQLYKAQSQPTNDQKSEVVDGEVVEV